jgi:hypothetical protein
MPTTPTTRTTAEGNPQRWWAPRALGWTAYLRTRGWRLPQRLCARQDGTALRPAWGVPHPALPFVMLVESDVSDGRYGGIL